ncbi:TonB-dependent receptor domain-containing protein [Niveispirillum fermenti]|uniref:TonB-dependent receptor domain-containing protein n=1 Tax=Niveispirillum fermenti TaxID=1233113 RepID=UPI003A8ABEF9
MVQEMCAGSHADMPRNGGGRSFRLGMVSLLALCAPLAAPLAAAQQPAGPSGAEPMQALDEIVVTGTRISGFTAPTPLTSVGAVEMQDRGVSTVSDLLRDVPQLKVNQNIGKSSEPIGASNADLRGLGTQRTLVLMNGNRVGATDPAGTIDTNIVPVALIRNVEIVTGGASAAYGSDAVAGVVNFVLDKTFQGAKADISYGVTDYGDFRRPKASVAVGHGFLDGKLHATLAADFLHNSGQTSQAERPWGRNRTVQLTNAAYTPTNGQPRLLIVENGVFSQMTPGGVVGLQGGRNTLAQSLAAQLGFAPGTGVQFGPNGQPLPFEYGTNVGGTYMQGGNGYQVIDGGNLLPEIERKSGYGRVSFEVSDDITLFADMLYSEVQAESDLAANPDTGTLTIRNDNAFLDGSVRAAMASLGLTSIPFGRINLEDGNSIFQTTTKARRWSFGAEGILAGNWTWSATGQITRNTYDQAALNNRIAQRWTYGIDSVINPATGQPICRVLLNNPNPTAARDPYGDIRGCIPINPFGAGSITQQAQAYYHGTSTTFAEMRQEVYAANISGSPFTTWAGPVSVAAGAEYRTEKTVQTSDANSAASRWRSINAQPFSGKYHVKEGYAEVVVPLADGAAFANKLDLNGAARYTDYSTSGTVWAWKIGGNYEPVADVRFRGTLSRDIRAPNNYELFSRGNQVINQIIDPRTNIGRQTTQITGGNPDLLPEKADTYSVGVVYQPGWLSGFRASFDYYNIKVKDAISVISAQDIVNFCFRGQSVFCSGVTQTNDIITRVNIIPFNANSQKVAGQDLEMEYNFPLEMAGADGDMRLRLLVNHADKLATTANGVTNDYVGLAGISPPPQGVPEWRVNLNVSYSFDDWKLGVGYRYISGGKIDTRFNRTVLDIADNRIDGINYFDANIAWDATANVTIYGSVENLTNEAPPITPNGIVQPTIANSPFFDNRGRFWVIGARARF